MPDFQITIDSETVRGLFEGDSGLTKCVVPQVEAPILQARGGL